MATNFEFYKDEILEITRTGVRIAMVEGKLRSCAGLGCDDCDFGCECMEKTFEWLYAEHIEAPKLTKRERAFCEAVQTGWIARDCDMFLYYFDHKPILNRGEWDAEGYHVNMMALGLKDSFMFIKDTDAECWAVEDLLKLEVQNETD